jgi:hypothetical protein
MNVNKVLSLVETELSASTLSVALDVSVHQGLLASLSIRDVNVVKDTVNLI